MRILRLILIVLALSFVVSGGFAPSAKTEKDIGDCVSGGYTLPWNAEPILRVDVRGCSSNSKGRMHLEEKLASGEWKPLTTFVVNLEPGEVVSGGFCARDGVHNAELVAAGPKSAKDCFMIESPRLAWRVDLPLKRFEPVDPKGIICDSPC